jgi:hypothetical protein
MSVAKAIQILTMIKEEIPRTMGSMNINLLYADIVLALDELKEEGVDTPTRIKLNDDEDEFIQQVLKVL